MHAQICTRVKLRLMLLSPLPLPICQDCLRQQPNNKWWACADVLCITSHKDFSGHSQWNSSYLWQAVWSTREFKQSCTIIECKASSPTAGKQTKKTQPVKTFISAVRLCHSERQPSLSSFEEQREVLSFPFIPHLLLLSPRRLASRENESEAKLNMRVSSGLMWIFWHN